jgi:transposase
MLKSDRLLGIIDHNDHRVYKKRLPNMPDVILAELEPFKEEIVGVVVESTFN